MVKFKTEIIVNGRVPEPRKEVPAQERPLSFTRMVTPSQVIVTKSTPFDFKFVELICAKYTDTFDLFFAYDSNEERHRGVAFFGHFNSGKL